MPLSSDDLRPQRRQPDQLNTEEFPGVAYKVVIRSEGDLPLRDRVGEALADLVGENATVSVVEVDL